MTMLRIFCAVLLILGLSSCGGSSSNSDLIKFMEMKRSQTGSRIEPLPTYPPYVSENYSASAKRSPFQPPISVATKVVEGVKVDAPDTRRAKEYLERFNIAELNMVGTLEQDNIRWALMSDPAGAIHRVREGNRLGKNYGVISKVGDQSIAVT